MTFEAVVKSAWASDPEFVSFCKTMYGPNASVTDVLVAERVAKMGPDVADVHVPGAGDKKKKRVLDERAIAKSAGFRRTYERDDNGRFSSAGAVAADSLASGAAGIGTGLAGQKAGSHAVDAYKIAQQLKGDPKARRALLKTLKSLGNHGGKAAGLAALAGLGGAMAGHHGKQAYAEVRNATDLNRRHRADVKAATTDLDFAEIAGGEATNARVFTRGKNDKVASTLISREGAKGYKEFGKQSEKTAVDMGGAITEIDADKRQVFGWASITKIAGKPVVDLQGDFIDDDELERAAYDYVHKSRVGGAMHLRVDDDGNVIKKNRPYHAADLIESVVFTDDKIAKMGISSDRTGWWVGFQVNDDDVWAKVKSGDWKGFSIHGSGRRTPTSLEELTINTTELGAA